jgi:hypothetical protein
MDTILVQNAGPLDTMLVFKTIIVYGLGWIIFGWLATYFPIWPLLKWSHKKYAGADYNAGGGFLVGVLERTLYVLTIAEGIYSFVPVWLLFKVAAKWKEGALEPDRRYPFNHYMIGTALSLLMGIVGALAVRLVIRLCVSFPVK